MTECDLAPPGALAHPSEPYCEPHGILAQTGTWHSYLIFLVWSVVITTDCTWNFSSFCGAGTVLCIIFCPGAEALGPGSLLANLFGFSVFP